MKVAIIGPPGVGKSTQATRLGRALPYYNPRLSSGELVRNEIQADTTLGGKMREYYERGEKVPDEVILSLVLPRLAHSGGWILDNFPANVAQGRALDDYFGEDDPVGLNHVILLEGPTEEDLAERIVSGRRTSRATGEVYHLEYAPPPAPEENLDPGPFEQRADDTEEATRAHFAAYEKEADALKEYYEAKGLLSVVDARKPIGEVTAEILEVLGHPENPQP